MTITFYPPPVPPILNALAVGEETFPRELITAPNLTAVSQTLKLTFFRAQRTTLSTQVRLATGGVAAAATPTLCRIGLWRIAADLSGTQVAAVNNDTTLFAASNTAYTRSWATPYTLLAGVIYAAGHLVDSGATVPTWTGHAISGTGAIRGEVAFEPRLAGALIGQTDLPASFTDAALSTTIDGRTYFALLP